jgi:Tfp pilus assembly protein PilF
LVAALVVSAAEACFNMVRRLFILLLISALCAAQGCATIRPGEISDLMNGEHIQKKPLESQLAMARLCERRGENEQARGVYEKILSESPQHPEALHRLAVVFTRENRREEARRYYTEAARLAPNSPELNNDSGYLFLLEGEYPAAEKAFRQAVELKPNFTAAWTNLGLALGYQDKYDDAFAVFLRATNTPADAHCNLAFVYAQQMKLSDAQTHYRRALVHNPELKAAAEGLLQVSASIPGQEPQTMLRTVASARSGASSADQTVETQLPPEQADRQLQPGSRMAGQPFEPASEQSTSSGGS